MALSRCVCWYFRGRVLRPERAASTGVASTISIRPSAIAMRRSSSWRLAGRVQLTADGHKTYLEAVKGAFGGDADYAMLVKLYGEPAGAGGDRRHSPGGGVGAVSREARTRPRSAPRTWSGTTSRCGWECAGSRG